MKKVFVGIVVFIGLFVGFGTSLSAQYNVLHEFRPTDGSNPYGDLISDGTYLYGMTERGGHHGFGSIFRVKLDGSEYAMLYSFAGPPEDGENPQGSLLLLGGVLYGTTLNGGGDWIGTIFKINTDGSGYVLLYSFAGDSIDGSCPEGALIESGGALYGMTSTSIFKMSPDGSGFFLLHHFSVGFPNEPRGSLVESGGWLYGATYSGGADNLGVIFKLTLDGDQFQIIHSFSGGSGDGARPCGSLLLSGGVLYGMTSGGGPTEMGTVFKMDLDGTDFSLLHYFPESAGDGGRPNGSLVESGGTLYGMTSAGGGGGGGGLGTIFKIDTDGSDYTQIYSFAGSPTDGKSPYGSLIVSGGLLYGMTPLGGFYDLGAAFGIGLDGNGFVLLHSFAGDIEEGRYPNGSLLATGGVFYGMTSEGGGYGCGVIFKMNPDGSGYTLLRSFKGPVYGDGALPLGSLIESGGVLYGTTPDGGLNYEGTIFKINPDGNGYAVCHDFSSSAGEGINPQGSLIASGGALYGMTSSGGDYGYGTVYRFVPSGFSGVLTVLHSFGGSAGDGQSPYGSLIEAGGVLYGMTSAGGANNIGAIFKIDPDGGDYGVIHSFDGSDGANPRGSLAESGGALFGMTLQGGFANAGTIFKINVNGTGFVQLHYFVPSSGEGGFPHGSLLDYGGSLYGMTANGGTADSGTIFGINPDGSGYAVIRSFSGGDADGALPFDSLIEWGGTLHGMTSSGGDAGWGVVFSQTVSQVTISGTVTLGGAPLASVVMIGLPGNPVTDASGAYSASVISGWSGTVTPALAGYTFTPASRAYANVVTDQLTQDYAAAALPTYTISGMVTLSGAPLAGVVMNGLPGNPVTDASGAYSAIVFSGWSGTATPALASHTFAPANRVYTNVVADTPGQDFAATAITYLISGTVTLGGTPLAGVVMSGLPGSPVTDAGGDYTATVELNWSGTVIPTLAGYGFAPANRSYIAVVADFTHQDYAASPLATYTISGTIASGGAPLAGVAMNGLPGSPVTDASGAYSAVVDSGWSGTVTPALAGKTFIPSSRTYASVGADKTNQWYNAAPLVAKKDDFDGDGKADILWRNYATGENRVWFLDGLTVKGLGVVEPVPDTNWVIVGSGDFNGDGRLDILWRHVLWGEVGIWFMDGTAHIGDAGLGPVPLVWHIAGTGDFDGDGKCDILWRNTLSGDVNIWLMDGSAHVGDALLGPVDLSWKIVGTGDFNGDGYLDILWRNSAWNEVGVWLMAGTAHAGDATIGFDDPVWTIVGTADFDGDGKIDILRRNYATGANVIGYMNGLVPAGAGALPPEMDNNWMIIHDQSGPTPPPPPPYGYVRSDFNGDGKSDVLWRNYKTGENRVWFCDGTTVLSTGVIDPVADLNWIIAGTGDFNGDGKPDILWRHLLWGEVGIWFMNGTAHIGDAGLGPVDLGWKIVETGDLDNDGRTDIFWRHTASGEFNVWLMDGTTHKGDVLYGIVDLAWELAGSGDFDGDGKTDILWRNTAWGEVGLWIMNGTARSREMSLGADVSGWTIVGTGDYDGDGKMDILRRNYATGENSVWYMNGTTPAGWGLLPPEKNPYWMIVYQKEGFLPPGPASKSDFNGDGYTDLVWRHQLSGEAGIWFMNKTAHFGSASLGVIDMSLEISGTGDFNGDGKPDLLWRNRASGEVGFRLMNGTAVLGDVSLGPVDLGWKITGVGEFSGDGKLDILWRHSYTGDVNIWLMDGTAHAGDVLLGAVDSSWKIVGTGDFNSDGKTDILWRNSYWGEVGVWLMDGTLPTAGIGLGNVDLVWEIAGTGDFNADGKVDILWRNTAWGEVGIWLMDGTTHVGDVSLGSVDLYWKLVRI